LSNLKNIGKICQGKITNSGKHYLTPKLCRIGFVVKLERGNITPFRERCIKMDN
jgi:hypothetical protein